MERLGGTAASSGAGAPAWGRRVSARRRSVPMARLLGMGASIGAGPRAAGLVSPAQEAVGAYVAPSGDS